MNMDIALIETDTEKLSIMNEGWAGWYLCGKVFVAAKRSPPGTWYAVGGDILYSTVLLYYCTVVYSVLVP